MNTALDDMPRDPRSSIHRRALTLAAILLALFVVATGLYGRYGYRFVLRVYAAQQLGRAENAKDTAKFIEYEDYLRIDPANLYMRGLLINQMIDLQEPVRALEVAKAGAEAVAAGQRPIAMLLVARAQIANGQIDEAERTYEKIQAAGNNSGEAHYGLAHIALAKGNLPAMRIEYRSYKKNVRTNSTPDFSAVPGREKSIVDSFVTIAEIPAAAIYYERRGEIGIAMRSVLSSGYYGDRPSLVYLLRGAYEEDQGHRDAALDFYGRGAKMGDALGKFAYARLSGAAQQNGPSGPK